jgi:hypothetical protein
MSADQFWDGATIAASIGCVLTVVGWVVQKNHTNKHEKRKELRLDIDKLNAEVRLILSSSHTYYAANKKAEWSVAHSEIITSFSTLGGIIQRIETRNPEVSFQKEEREFYDAITGGDFESKNIDRDTKLYAEKCKRFALLAQKLQEVGEDWFNKKYP